MAIGATDIASDTLSMKPSRVLMTISSDDDAGNFECGGRSLGRTAERKSRNFFSPWMLFESWNHSQQVILA